MRVLGVDDFAFRKGHAYGTILVDLERHRVVDLFEGHSVESIARWLGRHPGVEVVARDRSNVCREGVNAGAPDALQVADRWHLLHSLALALEQFLLHKRPALRKAAVPATGEEEGRLPGSIDGDVSTLAVRLGRPYASIEGPAQKRHERLVAMWKDIRRLHLAGASVRDIAEWVGTSQSTVYRYRERTEPPLRPAYRRKASVLDPYLPYLLGRWNEGCRSAKRLHAEIRDQGYRHSVDTVNRLLSSFRYTEKQGEKLPLAPRAKRGSIAGASPTAKNVAALFMRREEMLSGEQQEYLEKLCASDLALADARRLTQDFARMVRNLEGEKLGGWLEEAAGCEAAVMEKFAADLKKDVSAVRAGLTEEWSNGPVGGVSHQAQASKATGLREGELRPAQGEGPGGLTTASEGGTMGVVPASPRVRESPDFMSGFGVSQCLPSPDGVLYSRAPTFSSNRSLLRPWGESTITSVRSSPQRALPPEGMCSPSFHRSNPSIRYTLPSTATRHLLPFLPLYRASSSSVYERSAGSTAPVWPPPLACPSRQ